MFNFALGGQRVEAYKRVVDKAGMTHDEPALRHPVEKFAHQGAEIGPPREIIGSRESGIAGDIGARGEATKLRTQEVENQRLRRAEPPGQGLIASALANPGAGRGLLHRRKEGLAHPRK